MLKIFAKKFFYFPGCLVSSVMPEIVENYEQIFATHKIPYFKLDGVNCCGAVAYSNGYAGDFNELKTRNLSFSKRSR